MCVCVRSKKLSNIMNKFSYISILFHNAYVCESVSINKNTRLNFR